MKVVASDPRPGLGNEFRQWDAEVEADHDIMVVRNALPLLVELPSAAETCGSWESCPVINNGSEIGETGPGYQDKGHRDSDRIVLSGPSGMDPSPLLQAYGMLLHGIEGNMVSAYRQTNEWAEVKEGGGFELLRYQVGQKFGMHVDVVRYHPLLAHRRLAAVMFCNDDYEGGRLHFPRQDVTIEPEAGMLVMFPANFTHPHESTPVTRGVKYSVVSWWF